MSKESEHKAQPESTRSEDSVVLQESLFGAPSVVAEPPDDAGPYPPIIRTHPLTDQSSLSACAVPYQQDMMLRGNSNYTITCFLSDLKMFSEYMGPDTPIGRITKDQLVDWLMKLKYGVKDRTPAPKTMARRVTFLKNFFSWLARENIIKEDPAMSLVMERPQPPLPEMLFDEEVQRLLDAASEEPRAHCLIYLLIKAGLKKEELMGLKVQHIDLSNPQMPLVSIHFAASTGKQHRERRLALPGEFTAIFKKYLHSYHPTLELFDCTDRNLNYIVDRVVREAHIKKRVTLQILRDTYAVQQLREGVPPETLRERLGLSEEAWLEARERYRRLAFPK